MTVITVTQEPGDRRRSVTCHGTSLLTVVTVLMVVTVVTPWVMVWRVQGRAGPGAGGYVIRGYSDLSSK